MVDIGYRVNEMMEGIILIIFLLDDICCNESSFVVWLIWGSLVFLVI